MWRTKTMQATLPVLALLFLPSICHAQEDTRPPSYRIPGDPTLYTPQGNGYKPSVNLGPINGTTTDKTPEPTSYFHLEFIVKVIDSGKVTSSRTYNLDGNTDRNYHASYRADTSQGSAFSRNRTDIDCSGAHLVGTDSLSMNVSASISTDLHPGPPTDQMNATYSGSFYPLIPLGKPTIIFSADAQEPSRKIQMEVTATLIHLNLSAKP